MSLASDESMLVLGSSTVALAQTAESGPGGAIWSVWVGDSSSGSNAGTTGSETTGASFAAATGRASRVGGKWRGLGMAGGLMAFLAVLLI